MQLKLFVDFSSNLVNFTTHFLPSFAVLVLQLIDLSLTTSTLCGA